MAKTQNNSEIERLKQIKDLLFGDEVRNTRQSLDNLEKQFIDQVAELKVELSQRLLDVQDETAASFERIATQIESGEHASATRVAELEASLLEIIKTTDASLNDAKLGRIELADLLDSVAAKLRGGQA